MHAERLTSEGGPRSAWYSRAGIITNAGEIWMRVAAVVAFIVTLCATGVVAEAQGGSQQQIGPAPAPPGTPTPPVLSPAPPPAAPTTPAPPAPSPVAPTPPRGPTAPAPAMPPA